MIVLGNWFYGHPYCTDSDTLFIFLLTTVLIVSRDGQKRLINALNVNVNVNAEPYRAGGDGGDVVTRWGNLAEQQTLLGHLT